MPKKLRTALLDDGQMVEQIHLLDTEDAVHITTPPGYALVENRDGSYKLAKRVTDVP